MFRSYSRPSGCRTFKQNAFFALLYIYYILMHGYGSYWILLYMCTALQVECPLFLSEFNENLNFFWQIFKRYSFIRFHENPFRGSHVVSLGWKNRRMGERTDGRTDMMKLVAAFGDFVRAPWKGWSMQNIVYAYLLFTCNKQKW